MNKPGNRNILIALTVLALAVGAYIYNSRSDTENGSLQESQLNETVRVGVICPTGRDMPGYMFVTELAQRDVNAYCEDAGFPYAFEFTLSDSEGRSMKTYEITKQYHDEGIDLVVGYAWSSQRDTCVSYARDRGMLLLSTASSQPWYGSLAPTVYRFSPNDDSYAEPLARAADSLGITHVVALKHTQSNWAQGIHDRFIDEYKGTATEVKVSSNGSVDEGYAEYLDEAEAALLEAFSEVPRNRTALLFLCFREELEPVLREASLYPALMNVTWFVPQLYDWDPSQASALEAVSGAAETVARVRLIGAYPAKKDSEAFTRVEEAYLDATGEQISYHHANLYDSLWIMVLSVAEAESINAAEVSSRLRVAAENHQGITGYIHFSDWGDRDCVDWTLWCLVDRGDGVEAEICGLYSYADDEVTLYGSGG
ncbi:ABC transporter substrate-binding protein [Candidatus Bathyarchaeota archaeon]|nr:ABC transporter substrate-binding protein [Candidatus Bathyarchaeota archaeon]